MKALRDVGALIARIFISVIFVDAGYGKVVDFGMYVGFMTSHHIPAGLVHPLLYISIAVELVGGILLILGIRASIVAFIMFLFLIPVTIIFHVLPHQVIQWEKNLAIMGGLLMVTAYGPGGISFDGAGAESQ